MRYVPAPHWPGPLEAMLWAWEHPRPPSLRETLKAGTAITPVDEALRGRNAQHRKHVITERWRAMRRGRLFALDHATVR